jgi:hypothetical protein
MRRVVLEVKNSFTTVFSVLHDPEKPTWFSKRRALKCRYQPKKTPKNIFLVLR